GAAHRLCGRRPAARCPPAHRPAHLFLCPVSGVPGDLPGDDPADAETARDTAAARTAGAAARGARQRSRTLGGSGDVLIAAVCTLQPDASARESLADASG